MSDSSPHLVSALEASATAFSDAASEEAGKRCRCQHQQASLLWLQRNQTAPDGDRNSLGAAGGIEFVKDRSDMEFDRVLGNAEAPRDLFVSQAIGEHVQNLRLAGRQCLHRGSRRVTQLGLEDCWQMFKN